MVFGQNSILNASSPQTFREEREAKKDSIGKPLKYSFIEDKDILRSMVVWEIIDMNDKINPYLSFSPKGRHQMTEYFVEVRWALLLGCCSAVCVCPRFDIVRCVVCHRVSFAALTMASTARVEISASTIRIPSFMALFQGFVL